MIKNIILVFIVGVYMLSCTQEKKKIYIIITTIKMGNSLILKQIWILVLVVFFQMFGNLLVKK